MKRNIHIIQRQLLHIGFHADARPDALSLQLSRWVSEKLLPAVERTLDEAVSPDSILRIDSLTLDAGEVAGEDWEEILVQKICRALRQQIAEAPSKKMPLPAGKSYGSGLTLYDTAEEENLVFAYLQTGNLPWYASRLEVSVLMDWLKEMIEGGRFGNREGRVFLLQSPEALRRFLLQTPPALLESWFHQWARNEECTQLPVVIAAAKKLFGQDRAALQWSYALLFDNSPQALWQVYLTETYGDEARSLIDSTGAFLKRQLGVEQWQERMLAVADHPLSVKKEKAEKHLPAAPGYFIQNAGLVLLHPFLKNFFTALHLLSESGDWLSDAAHRRAVLLANYLCTESTEAAEYELPLCKLLTGYPFHQPVEAALEMSAEEKEEAVVLWQSVISQWSILKTTSPEGLRHSFLAREGKLSKAENGWLLQVEQKSFDLLLDHLPWGIGVIKNGWMPEMIFTEWV